MGNIGSHVDLTSGWPGHQADIEADGASRSENWSDGDFATGMPHPPLTATQVSIDSTARRPVATTTSAVASRLERSGLTATATAGVLSSGRVAAQYRAEFLSRRAINPPASPSLQREPIVAP